MLCFLSFNKLFIHLETGSLISWQLSFFKSLCWGIVLIAFGIKGWHILCAQAHCFLQRTPIDSWILSLKKTLLLFFTLLPVLAEEAKVSTIFVVCRWTLASAPECFQKLVTYLSIFKRLEITISNWPATNVSAFRSDRRTFIGLYLPIFNKTGRQESITCRYF